MGLRTLLLDRKEEADIGRKVCGDEISKSHFDATGIDYPTGDEISSIISGADVYPPNMENILNVRGWSDFDGWTVNRYLFGQRLLQEAKNAGVVFRPQSHVGGPIMSGGRVVGVYSKDGTSGEEINIYSKLVIDASGFSAVVRKKIDNPLVEQDINKTDIALCYREILSLSKPLQEPEVARVFLGGSYSPNGYSWIFPKGAKSVNAGVGVTGGQGQGSPKNLFLSFKEEYPLFSDSEVIENGGGAVPVRRPLKSLVSDGIAFLGDAALMVNPIHGGGIGAGMRAGIILGEVAKEAIARRNLTAYGLWHFNSRFLSNFGRRLASLEIFKRLLTDVADEEMNYGFEKRLLEAEDLMAANRGEGFSLGIIDKLRRIGRGIGNITLLRKLQRAASLMKKMDLVYSQYPNSPSHLETWNESVNSVLEQAVFK
jgi:geranylgeranyl reductase family protein